MNISHLSHNSIDKEKWDQVISASRNGLIYANSWYLDSVSPNWEALVSDDYTYVFPIPIKRKFKLPYIVQPILTQQLGLFSNQLITSDIIQLFIKKFPSYSYELNLNEHNHLPELDGIPNFVLDLNKSYEELSSNYSKNTVRNISKAQKLHLKIVDELSIETFISFYQNTSKTYKSASSECLRNLIEIGLQLGYFKVSGVINEANEMIAALCYTEFKQRITYLAPVSNEEGKKAFAMFYLVDQLIQREALKDKILDFEGSRIEGIARFYKGFGAKNHPYYILKNLRPSFLVGRI